MLCINLWKIDRNINFFSVVLKIVSVLNLSLNVVEKESHK